MLRNNCQIHCHHVPSHNDSTPLQTRHIEILTTTDLCHPNRVSTVGWKRSGQFRSHQSCLNAPHEGKCTQPQQSNKWPSCRNRWLCSNWTSADVEIQHQHCAQQPHATPTLASRGSALLSSDNAHSVFVRANPAERTGRLMERVLH